jgi:hypothetical protein
MQKKMQVVVGTRRDGRRSVEGQPRCVMKSVKLVKSVPSQGEEFDASFA